MPCNGCGENKEYGLVKMRFVGGPYKEPTGPYVQYETGKIYEISDRHLNKEAYPYWELVDEDEECVDCDEEEDESVDSTDSTRDNITLSLEESTDGLTLELGQEGSKQELVRGMDVVTLRGYIQANGGKVDGRWGPKKLIEEALKL